MFTSVGIFYICPLCAGLGSVRSLQNEPVSIYRSKPSLPHDLHQRQVQPEHRATGLLFGHLGPSGNHVRHAGPGENTPSLSACFLPSCPFCHTDCMCLMQHESEILPFPNSEKSFSLPEDIIQEVKEGESSLLALNTSMCQKMLYPT